MYNQLVEKAKELGYDVSKLHKTPQADPPPEADESPKDTKGVWWVKSLLGFWACFSSLISLGLHFVYLFLIAYGVMLV